MITRLVGSTYECFWLYRRSLSSRLDRAKISNTFMIWTVLLQMYNQRDRILVLHEQGMRNCDIASRLQMSGGVSNGSMIPATPVTASEKQQKAHNQHHLDPPAHQKCVQRNSTVSMRKISRETGISRESVRQIDKQELRLKPYKLQRVKLLTADNKRVRLERCLRLLRHVTPPNWERILFTWWKAIQHRTTGADAPMRSARLQSSSSAKIQSPWWFGPEFAPPVRPL